MKRFNVRSRRWHRWLLLFPAVWQLAFAPLVNDVTWQPLHLPFPMFWQMAGIVLTAIVIGCVYVLDRRFDLRDAGQSS